MCLWAQSGVIMITMGMKTSSCTSGVAPNCSATSKGADLCASPSALGCRAQLGLGFGCYQVRLGGKGDEVGIRVEVVDGGGSGVGKVEAGSAPVEVEDEGEGEGEGRGAWHERGARPGV